MRGLRFRRVPPPYKAWGRPQLLSPEGRAIPGVELSDTTREGTVHHKAALRLGLPGAKNWGYSLIWLNRSSRIARVRQAQLTRPQKESFGSCFISPAKLPFDVHVTKVVASPVLAKLA